MEEVNTNEIQLKPKRKKLPVWVNFSDLPPELQQAVGWESISAIIEADPLVQKWLKDFVSPWENDVEIISQEKSSSWWRTLWVSSNLLKKRNDKIVDWYSMWISFKTILFNINEASRKYWRWTIESEKTVRRIVAEYYTDIRPSTEEINVYDDAMREAAYAAHEQAIEKLTRVVINKPQSEWKSDFEYAIVLEKIIQAHQLKIENRGWNKTRANPITAIQNNTQINVINQNVDMYANKSKTDEKIQTLISRLDKILGD